MNIYITGGSGFIGSNLINYLIKNTNYNIRYCDNEKFSCTDNFHFLNRLTKDCSDLSDINIKSFENIDVLIHFAAIKKHNIFSSNGDEELIRTNIYETHRIFKIAALSKVKHIIFSSSLYAHGNMHKLNAKETDYPNPQTLYGNSKLFGENALASLVGSNNISGTALRLYFIYGLYQYRSKGYPSILTKNLERMRNGINPVVVNDGTQVLDYLNISDLCKLLHKIIQKPNSGFILANASSDSAITINNLIERLIEIWNRLYDTKFKINYEGNDFTKGTFRSGDRYISKLLWDWEPTISISEGLHDLIIAYNLDLKRNSRMKRNALE